MASQRQAPVRPRFALASLPAPAPPSNQVLQPRTSFIRPPFHQNFRLPLATPTPPPPPPPPPARAAPPATAPQASVVLVTASSSVPQSPKQSLSAPNSPIPTSQVPKLMSPSPTPPPSPFQASLAVSTTNPTIIITAPPPTTPPTSFLKIDKSHPNTTPSQSPKTWPISHPPSPPCEIKKHYLDSKGSGEKVITLAGDNNGATMKLSLSRKKGDSKSHEEGKSNKKHGVAFVLNSNVQGVNNSIIYNSSLTHHNPGADLSLWRMSNGAINE